MTDEEVILWSYLKANGIDFHFLRQCVMLGFVADFYCHEAALVLEVDGEIHHKQQAYDNERDEILRSAGIEVLRVTNQGVRLSLTRVLQEIALAVRQRTGR
jgi:very-short-patch-repair endonuclease